MRKNYLSRCLFKLSFLFFLLSCHKDSSSPPNNNELKATLFFSNGTTIDFNVTGSKALLGCGVGSGTYVQGINGSNEGLLITISINTLMCVSNAGTYSGDGFACQYRSNVVSGPIYTNNKNGVNNGRITFATINASYMEGHFNAVCYRNADSVVVNGTFKGDHLN